MQDKIKVSLFKNAFDKQPRVVDLKTIVERIRCSATLKNLTDQLRSLKTKKERQLFKRNKFPAITVSGKFRSGHSEKELIEHNGLIQVDIDSLNKLASKSIQELKKLLQSDPFTFILFDSVSGSGLKIFVRINSSFHAESFEALEKYYKDKYDLIIDPKCKDKGRLCFLSYDPDIWLNEDALVFAVEYSTVEPLKVTNLGQTSNGMTSGIEKITKEIEASKIDITDGYENWLKLGFALANELGEHGRNYFHRLSRFHPEYEMKKTDIQFTYCLKNNKGSTTINSFFYLAKKCGMNINIANRKELDVTENDHATTAFKSTEKNIQFYLPKVDNRQHIVDVVINYTRLNELLLSFGFRRFDVENDFIMVRIKENIVEEVKANLIQDTLFNYLESLPDILENGITKEMLIEKFNKSPETYFSKKRYSLLRPAKEYKFVGDSKEKCYIYYQNGFVECTAEGWQLINYNDLNGYIWRNQIHRRGFHKVAIDEKQIHESGDFAKFVFNVAGKTEGRFKSLCTIVGYNLHTYFEGKLKATILTDSKISDAPEGRTGKSLLIVGLGKIKKLCNITGKNFDATSKFKYQEADLDDQVVTLDDVPKTFDFEMLFNDITEGIKVEKKNLKPFRLKAKILISTNRTLKIEGASAKDRSIEFELDDHYNEDFSPQDEFKKWFFGSDFGERDWQLFDNFMMWCISMYLREGVLKPIIINLDRRKLLEGTNADFVEFMDSQVEVGLIQPGQEYLKKDLHESFLKEYPEYCNGGNFSRLRHFTSCLKLYAKYTHGFGDIKRNDERKSNEKRFIRFPKK